MSDWYQRAAERMAMEIATDSDACAIMATRRVRAVQADSGAMPTAEDYRLALVQCVVEKAADWRAACESARLASTEIARLRAELSDARKQGETGQPVLTDAEREAVELAAEDCRYHQDPGGRAAFIESTLRGLLARHGGCPDREQQARKGEATPARSVETGDDSPDRE